MVIKGYLYILECADGSYYTGSTKDLERRLAQHQAGEGANHTRKRLPVKLVYFETFSRIDEAFYREKQIQGWSRKKKAALIGQDFDALHLLAECRNETHWKNRSSSCRPSEVEGAEMTAGFDFAQPACSEVRLEQSDSSLSEAEMSGSPGFAQPAMGSTHQTEAKQEATEQDIKEHDATKAHESKTAASCLSVADKDAGFGFAQPANQQAANMEHTQSSLSEAETSGTKTNQP